MASPFRVFRKYQKTLLVVAGVILMFVFVIGDALVQYLGGPRSGGEARREATAVAVRWDDGSLTNQELANLVMRRRLVNSFLQSVEYAGLRATIEAGVEPRELRVKSLLGQPTEQSVVSTKLYADAAREVGMLVSDEMIVRYLDDLGRNRVSRDQMRALLTQAGGGRVPPQYVMDALREEMLARNYVASYEFAFLTVTPHQGYKDWLRVNDRVIVEAAAIPVESHLVDVPEPTETELKDFFEEHKEREPQPDFIGQMEFPSPVPGFRIPRKIDVQYIQANFDGFLTKVENEITDEEINKYYEENKDPYFIKADTGLMDLPADAPAADSNEQATEATDDVDEPADPQTENMVNPPMPETGTGTQQPPAESTEENAGPESTDQTLNQAEKATGVFRLTAFQSESSEPSSTESAATESHAGGNESNDAGALPGSEETESSGDQPVDESPAGDAPAAESSPEDKPVEYQPLEEVRDEIRTRLARDRVNEQLTTLINQLQSEVNAEFTTYFGKRLAAEAEGQPTPDPPAALTDLAPLAEKHGLQHGRTGPMSWLQFRETPVGASGDIESGRELYQILFATDDLALYQPITTTDIDGNRFLAIQMEDTPGRIPALNEIRDEVVRAWKMQKAAERAQARAEELAKEAEEAGRPLADFFADNNNITVVRTDPFARYTGGNVAILGGQPQQQPFRLSEPDGIVAAGPEFMDEVFSLTGNEVGSVLNHDHSIAYVVRVAEHLQSEEELRSAYLSEAGNWPGMGLMISDHAQIASRFLANDMRTRHALDWVRPPDEMEPVEDE